MKMRLFIVIAAVAGLVAVPGSISRAQDSEADAQRELEQIAEIGKSMPDPSLILRNLEVTARNAAQLPGYRANIERIRKQFAAKFALNEQPWSELDSRLRWHEGEVSRFEEMLRANIASLDVVQQEVDQARRTAQMAVDNQSPVWFLPDSELYQRLADARQKLAILVQLDGESDATRDMGASIDKLKTEIDQTALTLAQQILESTPPPPDGYQGPDRDQLLKTLAEKWAAEGNGKEVLKSGIAGPEWVREVKWVWENSAFHKTDTSRIQAWVLVPHNDQTAARHSLNFVIDHLASDSVSSWWVGDPSAEPPLSNQVLLSKISGN